MTADDPVTATETAAPVTSDYAVGYGRPTVEHRFQPGRSGNPKGRPRGSKRPVSVALSVYNHISRKVPVVENGRKKSIFIADVLAQSAVPRATKSDTALKQVLSLADLGAAEAAKNDTRSSHEEIRAILLKLDVETLFRLHGAAAAVSQEKYQKRSKN